MSKSIRIFLSLIVTLGLFFFLYWIPLAQITSNDTIAATISLLISMFVGLLVLFILGKVKPGPYLYLYFGGFIIGSLSFIIGYLGPGYFNPESVQGPYLGLFITGPIGFLMGIVAGGSYWLYKKNKMTQNTEK